MTFTTCDLIKAQLHGVSSPHATQTKHSCSSLPHANQSKHVQEKAEVELAPMNNHTNDTFAFEVAWNTSTTKGMKPSRTTVASRVPRLHSGTSCTGRPRRRSCLGFDSNNVLSESPITIKFLAQEQLLGLAEFTRRQRQTAPTKIGLFQVSGLGRSERNRPRYQVLEPNTSKPFFRKEIEVRNARTLNAGACSQQEGLSTSQALHQRIS